jgi:hypothetical protein
MATAIHLGGFLRIGSIGRHGLKIGDAVDALGVTISRFGFKWLDALTPGLP